jgi:predicted nucleic acid-binding protein
MFLLDTNILSAMMCTQPAPEVATWVAGQPLERLFTTAISQAEVLSGLAIMRDGRRRRDFEAAARAMFTDDFEGRVLPFDMQAAAAYADIFAARRRAGRPATTLDLMIASVARSRGASVVTRDIGGFEGCGVPVINPWDAAG